MADRSLLLVEGSEDLHVFVHLLKHHNIVLKSPETADDESDAVTIKDKGGIEPLLEDISVRLKGGGSGGLQKLGIVVDADLDIAGRWKELRDRLIRVGYAEEVVPTAPNLDGTIINQEGKPTVGIWLMPNNDLSGTLEDFIGFLVMSKDNLWTEAKICVDRIPETQRPFKHLIQKAYVHTWLAWQEEPGTPMGQAITKRYLDADAPHAQQLVAWVRQLFTVTT